VIRSVPEEQCSILDGVAQIKHAVCQTCEWRSVRENI